MEAEEMISETQSQQGRPFDIKHLITSCVANVIINMVFGRRLDHSDPEFQQLISDVSEGASKISPALDIFNVLRILPHYKKKLSDAVRVSGRIFDYINRKIAESHEVCIFTARQHSLLVATQSAVLAMIDSVRSSVRLSVCPSVHHSLVSYHGVFTVDIPMTLVS